jgi:hypothetical protein
VPDNNKWQKARIGLNGPVEFFEPNILNPGEELVILAKLNPLPGNDTTGDITIATPNGIYDSISFWKPGYTLLTPHSENTTIASAQYYQLEEASPADGAAITETTDIFLAEETGRKILHNENETSRLAGHIFPLTGISQIPAATWTVYYRCLTSGLDIQDNEVNFNIDILIRQADGTVRTTLATKVADAYLLSTEMDSWITKSATCNFPGYTVIDDSDYLEIVYYGEIEGNGSNRAGYLQIMIDDTTLPLADQTRIEA